MEAPKLLNFDAVVRLYGFTPNQLRWLIRTRSIEGLVRIGQRRLFFDPVVLDGWIEKNRIKSRNDTAEASNEKRRNS